ncbi:hypothetical protein BDP27DRAFT_1356071 [Rhodocollybia butyracea]|uniref:Uncharacterized protein n=1 Tax=Rhodocollybia butyracea TaxID=206335 RepID=A0A9P5TVJ2_9AGAR|nr:hypothetical protein BDP27DRAFT_1356071 [Rhodocollybia butyracea]
MQGGWYWSTLQAACYRCSGSNLQAVVQLLVELGWKYGSALQQYVTAQLNGESLLIEKGADVNAQGGKYGSALQAAAAGPFIHENIIQLLVEKGQMLMQKVGNKALHYNQYLPKQRESHSTVDSNGANENVVQILIEHGANVDTQVGKFGTPLQGASYGDMRIFQCYAPGGKEYGTALQAALAKGHNNIVELLIEREPRWKNGRTRHNIKNEPGEGKRADLFERNSWWHWH